MFKYLEKDLRPIALKFIMQVAMNSLCVYAFRLFEKKFHFGHLKNPRNQLLVCKIRPSGMNIERREPPKKETESHNSF